METNEILVSCNLDVSRILCDLRLSEKCRGMDFKYDSVTASLSWSKCHKKFIIAK